MPVIFEVIDCGDSGDTRYEGFVKATNNFATLESALSAAVTHILVGGGAGVAPVMTAATGTGSPVRATSPTLVTPTIGVATATSVNKVALTAPATSATVTIADGKTLTCSNTLTLAGTDSSTLNIGAGGTLGTGAFGGWLPVTAFTATPASTSTITMTSDLTASILVGMSLRYVIGGVTYYGRVSAIAANLLTVNGAPLSGDVTALHYGGGEVRQAVVTIGGFYEDANNTALIASDLKSSLIWGLPKSYLVRYRVYSNTHDTHATHGQASVRINGTEVNTVAGGLTIAADATWYSTVVDIATAAYDVNPTEAIEITAIKGGNGDAADLTVEMIFVTP